MPILFHDGKNEIYKAYSGGAAWNSDGIIAPGTPYTKWIKSHCNTEAFITGLFEAAMAIKPYAEAQMTLADYKSSDEISLIVLKGLHQWRKHPKGPGSIFGMHVTFGLDGYIWHVNALLDRNGQVGKFMGPCTRGESVTAKDHDGWTIVK